MKPGLADHLAPAVRARRRVALGLTAAMMVIYFGFIGLIAWRRDLLGIQIRPGLSLALALGAGVIVSCWVLTGVYVHWANRRYDPVLQRLRDRRGG